MSETIVVTVLVDNSVQGAGLMAEHGLSFYIRAGEERLLFDTGQSALLAQNARHLHLDLSRLRAMAISHGHFDHTGGLSAVWDVAPGLPLYAHPTAFQPRFARNPDSSTRAVGTTAQVLAAISERKSCRRDASIPTDLGDGFFLTGEIPRETSFEDVGGPFVLDEAGTRPDPIVDDQALFFDTRNGVVVLLGCAHAGVVNTLRHVRRLTQNRPLHAVLGGMHLLAASSERMQRTLEALRELNVPRLGPAHCTGVAAAAQLWQAFPQACTVCSVGSRFVFHRQPGFVYSTC